jgi:PIN domain nuclease of toxin-antitoxin system
VKLLLDTHFLLWSVLGVARLDEFDWLDRYRPWGVSPISFLEVKFLAEVGRLEVHHAEFMDAVKRDARFTVDEVPLMALIERAMPLEWTRDPFDRLLTAHSLARRTPFCTVDRVVMDHHPMVVRELRE